MVGAKPSSTPIALGSKLAVSYGDPLDDLTNYRSIVEALQYCTLTHPEIRFAVNQLR
jgi:hypothetical protein